MFKRFVAAALLALLPAAGAGTLPLSMDRASVAYSVLRAVMAAGVEMTEPKP